LSQVGEKIGEVAGRGVGRVTTAPGQEPPELEQVGAVGGERVAGEPALELEVREEVQHQRLVALRGLVSVGRLAWRRNRGHAKYFRSRPPVPSCPARSSP
jgi:hypothetical protein